MSEFRKDAITGRWRLIAEGRSARPTEYATAASRSDDPDCPFCEGHEARTTAEVAAVRPTGAPANGPGWTIRSVPNKFPTVTPEVTPVRPAEGDRFLRALGVGFHEVVIESPTHSPGMPDLAPAHLRELFRFFRERVRAALNRPSIESVLLFQNQGPESGGTLSHPHAQLLASEIVPSRLTEESDAFLRTAASNGGGCLLESVAAAEVEARDRFVLNDGQFVVFAPFASEHPYEVWIVPDRHAPSFTTASDGEVDRLAELLPLVLRALDRIHPNVSYNWFVHGWEAPTPARTRFHWHVEVAPRLVRADGYDLGSGVPVNPVAPEHAAAQYRAQVEADAGARAQKR
jgi:UDPglucose--hexose-1-phosphate uridylyltransferase